MIVSKFWNDQHQQALAARAQNAPLARAAVIAAEMSGGNSANPGERIFVQDPTRFIVQARDIRSYYAAKMEEDWPALNAASAEALKIKSKKLPECHNHDECCSRLRETLQLMGTASSVFTPVFNTMWQHHKANLLQLYRDTFALMRQIQNDAVRKDVYLWMVEEIMDTYNNDLLYTQFYWPHLGPDAAAGLAQCDMSPSTARPATSRASAEEPPAECDIPGGLNFGFGPVSLTVTCDGVALEVKPVAGTVASLSYDPKGKHGPYTMFVGAESGVTDFSAKGGIFVTFDSLGPGGNVTDIGINVEAQLFAGQASVSQSLVAGPDAELDFEFSSTPE